MSIPVSGMSVDRVGDDDSHPFLARKVPVITIHSLTSNTFPILHSGRDTEKTIDFAQYYASYRLATFYLAYLNNKLE